MKQTNKKRRRPPKKNKIVLAIKSKDFAVITAIISMLVQTPHTAVAFADLSSLPPAWSWVQAIVFALVIDMAILVYTVRNRVDIALGAAIIMFLINIYYYSHLYPDYLSMGFGVLMAAVIPISVYYYSEEI